MIATRRGFIATSAAAGLLSGAARAAEPSVDIVDYDEGGSLGPDLEPDPEAAQEVVTTPEGRKIVLHARFPGFASDQWPMVSFTNDPDEYLAASGDGIGFLDDPAVVNNTERKKLIFSRIRFVVDSSNFVPRRYQAGMNADIKSYGVSEPDDLKPNALFYDQNYGDLHCFVARGNGALGDAALVNRRRAWLISSFDQGANWNVSSLPSLGVDPVFDAVSPANELVPIGVCNQLGGSILGGYIYFYFNRQGNVKSDELYPGQGGSTQTPDATRKPVYCARIAAPPSGRTQAQRIAHFKNPSNYFFRTSSGWSSTGGAFSAAVAVHNPSNYMGKHFLVWYVPSLSTYVAAKTHSLHRIWLATAPNPWGPFTQVFDKKLGETADRDDLNLRRMSYLRPRSRTAAVRCYRWLSRARRHMTAWAWSRSDFLDHLRLALPA